MNINEMSYSNLERNDGGQLAYYTRLGIDPPLVLIPGSFSDRHDWVKFLSSFDSGRRIVIVEMRGHGNSQPPSVHSNIEGFADDILRVVDALRLTRWYVVGHGVGGMVEIELSGRRPASIVGLVALEGWSNHKVLDDAFDGDVYNTLSAEQQSAISTEHLRVMSHWNDRNLQNHRNLWLEWEAGPVLSRTRVPILEVWGDRGRTPPDQELIGVPERENIEVRWIEGASHALLSECPEKVAEIVQDFISRVKPA